MAVQTLEFKPVVSVAKVMRYVTSPLKMPAWFVVIVVLMAGVYGYVSGRQNPVHHYVPYVGYPLVMDTTTGKACYATTPKPAEDAAALNANYPAETTAVAPESIATMGPAIPMCGK